jgi:segregation and condensation protein A
MTQGDDFEDSAPPRDAGTAAADDAFVLRLESYEGPIDVLLEQAREQKVDLTQISILALADQYLSFVERARRLRLELAADYLVMAAWLAYLKSRLLLPEQKSGDEPTGEEMAEALAFQLRRLEAMREAAAKLMAQPRLGVDRFARGEPERDMVVRAPVWQVSLYDLLKAYGDHKRRQQAAGGLHIEASRLMSMDDALRRLMDMLGAVPGWAMLTRFLPEAAGDPLFARSAVAATFAAALELARSGRVELRQDRPFAPLYLRRRGEEA